MGDRAKKVTVHKIIDGNGTVCGSHGYSSSHWKYVNCKTCSEKKA